MEWKEEKKEDGVCHADEAATSTIGVILLNRINREDASRSVRRAVALMQQMYDNNVFLVYVFRQALRQTYGMPTSRTGPYAQSLYKVLKQMQAKVEVAFVL